MEAIMVKVTEKLIDIIRTKLVETYNPLEIYLFGSYVWGSSTENSDLDLLIVVDELSNDRLNLLVDGYMALSNLGIAKDLFLYTKKEFEENAADIYTICFKVKQDGKQIYAKA